MKMRQWLMSAGLTAGILLIGMLTYHFLVKQKVPLDTLEDKPVPRRVVEVCRYTPALTPHEIQIDGRLEAYERVSFVANTSGILLPAGKVLKTGTFVKKGALLFEIDSRKAIYNLHAQRSQLLHQLTLMLPDLKLDYPAAYEKWMTYLSDFEIEQPIEALPKSESEQEKFFIASRNIQQLYYRIKNLEANLIDFKVYAPFSGVMTSAPISAGSMVNPGQLLGAMINTGHFELKASVPEQDLHYLEVGSPVALMSEEGGQRWRGQVRRVGQMIDPSTQNVPIFIGVQGRGLREQMYLKGTIAGTPLNDVVKLPAALVTDQSFLYTVRDSIVQRFELAVVKRDPAFVFANNVPSDRWVICSVIDGLYEGQRVIPQSKVQ